MQILRRLSILSLIAAGGFLLAPGTQHTAAAAQAAVAQIAAQAPASAGLNLPVYYRYHGHRYAYRYHGRYYNHRRGSPNHWYYY
jgi:hypothetical protein